MKILKINNCFLPFLIFALLFLTRFMLITDPLFIIDADESVLGLMAAKLSKGEIIPPCFTGQKYGLAFIEAIFISASSLLFKNSATALNSGILLLWTIGMVNFYLIVKSQSSDRQAFILSLLLVLSPAWYIWSMKARGGYVTGFVLTQIFLKQIYCQSDKKLTFLSSFLTGILITLIYYSQVIWFITIIPYLIYRYFQKDKIRKLISLTSGTLISYISLHLLNNSINNIANAWFPPIFSYKHIFANFRDIFYKLTVSFSGSYYYYQSYFNKACFLYAFLISIVFALFIFRNSKLITRSKKITLKELPVISCLSLLLFLLLFNSDWLAFRYFLPLFSFILLNLAYISWNKLNKWLLASLISINILALIELQPSKSIFNRKNSPKPPVIQLIKTLNNCKISNVYTLDIQHSLQYQLLFYSKQKLKARELLLNDRIKNGPIEVDQAFIKGENTALITDRINLEKISLVAKSIEHNFTQIINISDSYFIIIGINKDLLKRLNFELIF